MINSNEKFKWLKPILLLIVFSFLASTACADNSTDYGDEDELETVLIMRPAPPVIPQCGLNEVYQNCEVNCIDCEHRGMCEPQNCNISHCDCKRYFVHITPGGPCEHVSACPTRECAENEVYRHCGSYCEYCDMSPCRTLECSSSCYCKAGYRRIRETGKCVPENECPQRLNCASNDEVAESGPFSEHCLQTESETLRANETIEEEKCYCASGYKRNLHGYCIEEANCIYVQCYEGTEFQDCPRKCNTTCWNYGDPSCEEDGQCYPGCFCREGSVLNEFFACIPLDMCPPGSNPFAPTLPPPTIAPIPEPAFEETSNSSAKADAESSSAATEDSSAAVAESSSGTGSSSAEATESATGSEPSAEGTEKPTEKAEETTPEDKTTVAPKKMPKKATSNGKIYKSAARPGKTVAPFSSDDDTSSKSSAKEEE